MDKLNTVLQDPSIKITDIAMCADFLVYSTNKGSLHHFYLSDWGPVNEYK